MYVSPVPDQVYTARYALLPGSKLPSYEIVRSVAVDQPLPEVKSETEDHVTLNSPAAPFVYSQLPPLPSDPDVVSGQVKSVKGRLYSQN